MLSSIPNNRPPPGLWQRFWRFYRKWQLRRAQEKYAYYKARRTAMERTVKISNRYDFAEEFADIAGKEAKYMERVEVLMREQ